MWRILKEYLTRIPGNDDNMVQLGDKGREKLEHHPSLLPLPSDVVMVLLGATV